MPGIVKLAEAIGIRGFIAIALAIALGIVMWRADTISGQRDDAIQAKATEVAQHAVTRQSVATLQAELAKFIGAGKAAKIAGLAAIEAQAKDSAKLQAQADAIRAEMANLQPSGQCRTPDSILNAEGL